MILKETLIKKTKIRENDIIQSFCRNFHCYFIEERFEKWDEPVIGLNYFLILKFDIRTESVPTLWLDII